MIIKPLLNSGAVKPQPKEKLKQRIYIYFCLLGMRQSLKLRQKLNF